MLQVLPLRMSTRASNSPGRRPGAAAAACCGGGQRRKEMLTFRRGTVPSNAKSSPISWHERPGGGTGNVVA